MKTTMAFWKIVTLVCAFSILVDAKWLKQKRGVQSHICDPVVNNTHLVQCYCTKDKAANVRTADCYLTDVQVQPEDRDWKAFRLLENALKITYTNTRGVPLKYIPTESIIEAKYVKKFEIKYGLIDVVDAYAFANSSSAVDLILSDNKIRSLAPHSFANHKNLRILTLDTNLLTEINRDVFENLPALEKLYLTNNEINTIHDRAFINLGKVKELEIDRNKVFSLNSATFVGLKSLEKLELGNNALEVIGDNTFSALENLKYLNLDENNIQMLDDKAFSGLGKLLSLSLARNKLIEIKNDNIFVGLHSIQSLSLKGNQIQEIKSSVVAPILNNFYENGSTFYVDDNNFPCECKLDWFIELMNKTQSKHLKMALENFKCIPDEDLQENWTKFLEEEAKARNNSQGADQEQSANDYEYYDETQLNGKLFYLDVRDLLLCDNQTSTKNSASPRPTTINPPISTSTMGNNVAHKVPTNDRTSPSTTQNTPPIREISDSVSQNTIEKAATIKRDKIGKDFTTTRLATVSAKPVESKIYEDMASDEGVPDNIKSQRHFENENTSGAPRVSRNIFILVLLLSLDVLIFYY